MSWILHLPGAVRLGLAFLLILLLPGGFIGLCLLAMRQASAERPSTFLSIFTAGLTLALLVWLALRHSPAVLGWCLGSAALLSAVPFALDLVVRRGGGHSSPLPAAVRVAIALFVPLFFLWLALVEEILQVTLPHIFFYPTR